jgi:uncharacterized protein (TIGR03000 family)
VSGYHGGYGYRGYGNNWYGNRWYGNNWYGGYGGYGFPWFGLGLGLGYPYYGGYGGGYGYSSPYYGGYTYSQPYYGSYLPSSSVIVPAQTMPTVTDTATAIDQPVPAAGSNSATEATLQVTVPDGATVAFDNTQNAQTGTTREFVTPPLSGPEMVTVTMSLGGRTWTMPVHLNPGDVARVDMTNMQ